MNALDFQPKKHLTNSDQKRLEEKARAAKQTPEDYVETVIKQAIFAESSPNEQRHEGESTSGS